MNYPLNFCTATTGAAPHTRPAGAIACPKQYRDNNQGE